MKEVVVAGAFVRDVIIRKESVKRSLGGIYHNVHAFLALMRERQLLRPVSTIGADIYDDVISEFRRSGSKIRLDSLVTSDQPSLECTLTYFANGNRLQNLKNRSPRIDLTALVDFQTVTAALLNFVDGSEIDLEAALKIKQANSECIVYVDAHNIDATIDSQGRQSPGAPRKLLKIAPDADFIQMNRWEAASALSLDSDPNTTAIIEAMSLSPIRPRRAWIVTLDQDGAICREFVGKRFVDHFCKPVSANVVDPTGCGDVFSAAFICGLLDGKTVIDCMIAANQAASMKCSGKELSG